MTGRVDPEIWSVWIRAPRAVGSGRSRNQQIGMADCKHGFGGADDAHCGILRTPARQDANDGGRLTPIDDRVILRVLYPRANHKEGSSHGTAPSRPEGGSQAFPQD